jgi:hypothetical protein
MRFYTLLFLLFGLTLSSCSSIGPSSVKHDRVDYNKALEDSWKEQVLLNILRLRYAGVPIFLEVSSIVSGYTVEGSVNLAGNVSSADAVQGDYLTLGAGGKFTDRPTITYAPLKGAKFTQSFMTPIPPKMLLFLLESGWSAEVVLPLAIESLNGLRGRSATADQTNQGNQEFYRLIRLISEVQDAGTMSFRIIKGENDQETIVIFFYNDDMPDEIIKSRREINRLLGIDDQVDQITITFGVKPKIKNEVALLTRSMLRMMLYLSTTIEVPESHLVEQLTYPINFQPGEEETKLGLIMRINSGTEEPERAFASVKHMDHWFWIEESDIASKRILSFVCLLFTMLESDDAKGLPLVTIPAG